jgi:Sporulation and spore germination
MIPRHLLIGIGIMLMAALAMSAYVWRMRRRVAAVEPPAADTRPLAPPVSGPREQVTLYVADDEAGSLRVEGASIPLPSDRQQRAEELLRELLGIYLDKASPHPIPPASEVRAIYLVDPGLAVIDLNAVFADAHRSGVLEEELTVTSLIQTLAANIPGILRVKILVDGKERATLAGHADLANFYDVAAVNRFFAQAQAGQ